MIVTFHRDGAEDLRWENFKPGKLMTTEAEAIEKVTGMSFGEWGEALMNSSATANRALIWVLRKRDEPTLRYRDVDFPMDAFELDFDAEERSKLRFEAEHNADLTDEQRQQLLTALGPEEDAEPSTEDGQGNASEETGNVAA